MTGVSKKYSSMDLKGFFNRQVNDIKNGGVRSLTKKLKTFCTKMMHIPLFLLSLPIVLFIRIIKPFRIIRIGQLDIDRIGAMCKADWYLNGRMVSHQPKRLFDIFYFYSNNTVCNKQWVKMWKRVLRVFPFPRIAGTVKRINNRYKGWETHNPLFKIHPRFEEDTTKRNEFVRILMQCPQPHIYFTSKEEHTGREELKKLGIPEDVPFICFHARDPVYLNTIYPDRDWTYHNYRDSSIRSYIPAVMKMTEKGYYAIRMGAVVNEKLDINKDAIIDYATIGARTDFRDIYLGAKCKFFICSDTGISVIPECFRVPVVYTNWVELLEVSMFLKGLFILKKFLLIKENRYLSFKEIMNLKLDGATTSQGTLKKYGIMLIENTPDEIMDVSVEMDERLKGTWVTTEEDEILQKRFWRIFGDNILKSQEVRLGSEFLRQNQELLI